MPLSVPCARCQKSIVEPSQVYSVGALRGLCEACADRVAACPHDVGDQETRYDADGVGYRVWRCHRCDWFEFDPY